MLRPSSISGESEYKLISKNNPDTKELWSDSQWEQRTLPVMLQLCFRFEFEGGVGQPKLSEVLLDYLLEIPTNASVNCQYLFEYIANTGCVLNKALRNAKFAGPLLPLGDTALRNVTARNKELYRDVCRRGIDQIDLTSCVVRSKLNITQKY